MLEVGPYSLEITPNEATLVDSDEELTLSSGQFSSLHYTPSESTETYELMTCHTQGDMLIMHHLEVPNHHRGQGLGRLSLAVFYVLAQQNGCSEFALKFGGGNRSSAFLEGIGFSSDYIHTGQDADFPSNSAMVGEFTSTGERSYDWRLDAIPLAEFPTNFFSLS